MTASDPRPHPDQPRRQSIASLLSEPAPWSRGAHKPYHIVADHWGWRERLLGLLVIGLLLAALLIIIFDARTASAEESTGAVCPPGSTKYEAGFGYEYGDRLTQITTAGPTATWTVIEDNAVVDRVCVKAGQDLYWPASDPRGGAFTTPDGKDVSHVVTYLVSPNRIGVVELTAEPEALGSAILIVLSFGALGIFFGVLLARSAGQIFSRARARSHSRRH